MIRYKKQILGNGLTVLVAPMENTETVTLLVLVGVGSRHEGKSVQGVSHFLEHLFFKGSKRRPRAGQVHEDLDRIGAQHNAFTSKEWTGFWVKSARGDFDIGLDIVSDILLEPLFKKEEIEKERGVVIQEISMYEDDPKTKVWEILESVLYKDQPIGRPVLGTIQSVGRIGRKEILQHKADNYFAQNIVVTVAGNIDPLGVLKKIQKVFLGVKKGRKKFFRRTRIIQKTPKIEVLEKDSEQTHLALGLRICDKFDKRKYALNLLSVIVAGNTSSRFFKEIRERLGLAYYVYSSPSFYTDCGSLDIGIGVAHNQLLKTLRTIAGILGKMKRDGISLSELRLAKNYLRGEMALNLESSDEIASFLACQEIHYKRIQQPEDILKKIERVDKNDMMKIIKEFFVPSGINMAIIGKQRDFFKKENYVKSLFKRL
jgi:predicted Zn-dependent peptidase